MTRSDLLTSNDKRLNKLQEGFIQDWLDSRKFELPIIGVSVLPSDVPIIGGAALAVIGIWFFYSTRREHQNIAFLL